MHHVSLKSGPKGPVLHINSFVGTSSSHRTDLHSVYSHKMMPVSAPVRAHPTHGSSDHPSRGVPAPLPVSAVRILLRDSIRREGCPAPLRSHALTHTRALQAPPGAQNEGAHRELVSCGQCSASWIPSLSNGEDGDRAFLLPLSNGTFDMWSGWRLAGEGGLPPSTWPGK